VLKTPPPANLIFLPNYGYYNHFNILEEIIMMIIVAVQMHLIWIK